MALPGFRLVPFVEKAIFVRAPVRGDAQGRGRPLPPAVRSRGLGAVVLAALLLVVGLGASSAAAAGKSPAELEIVPRSVWDPDGTCRPSKPAPRVTGDVHRAIVHHTVRPRRHPRRAGPAVVRRLCRSHVHDRGFRDIGYHFLIDRYGRVYEGRAGGTRRPLVGAHAEGHNDATFGVALIGNYQLDDVPDAAMDALHRLLAWKLGLHGVEPREVAAAERRDPRPSLGPVDARGPGHRRPRPTIVGHRDTGRTLCPGGHLYAALDGVGRRVAALMRRGVHAQVVEPAVRAARPPEDAAPRTAPAPIGPVASTVRRAPRPGATDPWTPDLPPVAALAVIGGALLCARAGRAGPGGPPRWPGPGG